MALVGYLYGITSEQRLAEELRLHLACMWFVGYDLDERTPGPSVLSKARRRFCWTVCSRSMDPDLHGGRRDACLRGFPIVLSETASGVGRGWPRCHWIAEPTRQQVARARRESARRSRRPSSSSARDSHPAGQGAPMVKPQADQLSQRALTSQRGVQHRV